MLIFSYIAVLLLGIFSPLELLQGSNQERIVEANPTIRSKPPFYYYPVRVQLEGYLRSEQRFGPPGFGEDPLHDIKIHIFVLHLSTPMSVKPNREIAPNHQDVRDTSVSNILQVQVFGEDLTASAQQLQKLVGRKVFVVGTLSKASAPSEFTEVTISADTVTAVQSSVGR